MNKIKIRLKEEVGKSLTIATPSFSIVINNEGENNPDGFEVDKEIYENYLKPYAEPVPKKKKKEEREEIKRIDLEE